MPLSPSQQQNFFHPCSPAIVCFARNASEIVGTGFLVSPKHILTCAHVVNAALGKDINSFKQPLETIPINFPFVAELTNEIIEAKVVLWLETDEALVQKNKIVGAYDIAGLELQTPIKNTQPVKLLSQIDLYNHAFQTCGFPNNFKNGIWVDGRLMEYQANGWLQMEGNHLASHFIKGGFSGAPVYNRNLKGVVGMVAAAFGNNIRVAQMIPNAVLLSIWNILTPEAVSNSPLATLTSPLPTNHISLQVQENKSNPPAITAKPLKIENNLPKRLKKLLGREEYLQSISEYLADPDYPIITLVGQGGVGKTQLALHTAKLVLDSKENNFLDGIFFVTFESLTAAIYIPNTIAQTLKLPLNSNIEPWQAIINGIADKQMLLILDNLEHLIDQVANSITELIEQCPNLTLLVTSRAVLNIDSELVFELSGLSLPQTTTENFEDYGATALFLSLAKKAKRNFNPSLEEKVLILNICRLIEGWPLGIELAAAWVKQMPLVKIAEQIEHNIDFLKNRSLSAVKRHSSVRAVFDYSWQLLSAEAQRIMRQLAVFRGGFELEAATKVVNANAHELAELVDKSLLKVLDSGRYHSHSLIHQIIIEKLKDYPDEHIKLHNSHAEYYLDIATEANKGLDLKTSRSLENELANFRAALQWCVTTKEIRIGLNLAINLTSFWFSGGYLQEGYEWFVKLLKLPKDDEEYSLQAKALQSAGYLAVVINNLPIAYECFTKSLAMFRKLQDKAMIANVLSSLGEVHSSLGNYELAIPLLEESYELAQSQNDSKMMRQAMSFLGHNYQRQLYHDKAQEAYTKHLKLAEQEGDFHSLHVAKLCLGDVARLKGDYKLAEEYLLAARAAFIELDEHNLAMANYYLAIVYTELNNLTKAKEYLNQGLQIFKKLASSAIYDVLEEYSVLASLQQKWQTAAIIKEAVDTLRPENTPVEATEIKRFQKNLVSIQKNLPPTEFAKAQTQGNNMNLDELINYVL